MLTLANAPSTAVYNTVRARKGGINREAARPADGQLLTLAGWGRTSGAINEGAVDRLRQTTVTAVDWATCVARVAAFGGGLSAEMGREIMCTKGAATTSACRGDSGGPLFWRTFSPTGRPIVRVAGIVSFGYGTAADVCPPGGLNFFARVSTFADWIDSQMDPGWRGWNLAP